jgi:hypothetical protein
MIDSDTRIRRMLFIARATVLSLSIFALFMTLANAYVFFLGNGVGVTWVALVGGGAYAGFLFAIGLGLAKVQRYMNGSAPR